MTSVLELLTKPFLILYAFLNITISLEIKTVMYYFFFATFPKIRNQIECTSFLQDTLLIGIFPKYIIR